MIQALIHASEILTGHGVAIKDGRKIVEEDLGRIQDGAIVFNEKKILWTGRTSDIPRKFLKIKRKNLKLAKAVIPGFVDCHTHLVFAGDRATEFARRCAGETYAQIAAEGGGILTTVNATRSATEEELFMLAVPRVEESIRYGVRTLEIKSGYGLTTESEIKTLKVIRKLKNHFKGEIEIVATFLGAHAFPKEMSEGDYLNLLVNEMLPQIAKKKLADSCDVFVDKGYFTIEQATQLLTTAQKHGLKIKIHADELGCTDSAVLAAEMAALSADHLLKISEKGIAALSKSNTVAVLLPGTAFYLKENYAPARALLDAGACVALSTDFNPGTCVTLSLPTIMTFAALYQKMSKAEIFAAVTYNAAKALGLENRRGTLKVGQDSNQILELPFQKFEETYYRFSWS